MKFWEIFRFEFAYQCRRPWFWVFAVILLVLNFLMSRDRTVSDAVHQEILANSPFVIANATVFGGLLWLMMAAMVAGDAAARDVATRMDALVYTSSIKKTEYLAGKFLAAILLNSSLLLAVQIGILLGIYGPGVDPEIVAPFRAESYLTAYAYLALPNAFVGTALQFALASASGRAMASYFGSFVLFFMGFFVASLLLFRRGLGTLLDPIGIRFIVEDIAHLWTPVEKNLRLLTLDGSVLTNRLLWVGVGIATVTIMYITFKFTHRTNTTGWQRVLQRNKKVQSVAGRGTSVITNDPIIVIPRVARRFGFLFHWRQMSIIAWSSFRTIAASWPGLFLFFLLPLLTIPVIVDQMQSNGVPLVPTAIRVINELTAPLSAELSRWVIIPALLIYFAGELVWRERDAGLNEINDTIPGSEWVPFIGKFIGLALVLMAFATLQLLAGLVAQEIMNYTPRSYQNEIRLFISILLGLQLIEYLLFALMVLAIHVVVNHKYVGHIVASLAYVFIALSSLFGGEHDLLIFGASPAWTYTEMRGFGGSLTPWLWFKLYWIAWSIVLAVIARLFWVRGDDSALNFRIQMARHRFDGLTLGVLIGAVVAITLSGGYIFYNTNVRNTYLTTAERKGRQAEYERRYSRYSQRPQPESTKASLQIEIFPDRRQVEIRGRYTLVNRTQTTIDSIHVATIPGVKTTTLLDRRSSITIDEIHGHRIFILHEPLQPSDSLQMDFVVDVKQKGFTERGYDPSIALNGTYFTNSSWFPAMGYQAGRELLSAGDRRDHGLTAQPAIAHLNGEEDYHARGHAVAFDVIVGTNSDQIAVAPGTLRRSWIHDQPGSKMPQRRYFHYSSNSIGSEWSFFSAKYAVHKALWTPHDTGLTPLARQSNSVDIQIFHHPEHTAHIDRLLQSIRASLNFYTANFGPYRRNYLHVVERPGNGVGMHADAGMLSHAEGFTFWNPSDDSASHDHPYAIVAHEVAHQWTVPYAPVEGAPVMSESLAWYYAMKAIEHSKGTGALHQLFNYMWQPHPCSPIFRGEPLLRGLDPYMAYRKGPFALYTVSKYIGEERVNRALRQMLEKHQPVDSPLATTLDLYKELQAAAPDSLHHLLHELFEVNTYWKFKTEHAIARQTPSGAWEVTLEVDAQKVVVDSAGVKTNVAMNESIEIGVFAEEKNRNPNGPLYLQKHRIRSGRQTIKVNVSAEPARAGIDPYHILNWEERSDKNMRKVKVRP